VKARVRRTRGGDFEIRLPDEERELLASLLPQLRELLTEGDAGSLRRLFPPAYANDPERDAEYQSMVHDDLLERRLAAVDLVEQTLSATRVGEEQLLGWMGAINDIRLVLGTRLDVGEEVRQIDADDPEAPAFAVYDYLTWLLGQIIDALADG
jgi:hypothetical protein